VTFAAKSGQAVRVVATSEAGNSGPWSSGAEFYVIGTRNGDGVVVVEPPPPPGGGALLPRAGWTATASSFEAGVAPPYAVLDPSTDTLWHSQYSAPVAQPPHTLTVTFGGGTNRVTSLIYSPRTDGSVNGRIGQYEVRAPPTRADYVRVHCCEALTA
jgi:galactose oxidase